MPSARRFRVASLEPDGAGLLHVDAGVHRHLRVLRLAPGARVRLFDGQGAEVEATIEAIDDESASLRVVERVERSLESAADSCLIQALPARLSRMETIVRQVTELGVGRIVPVIAERSQASKRAEAAFERRAERWRRVAAAAAEQSGRTRLPRVDDVVPLANLDWAGLPRPLFLADAGVGSARRPEQAASFSVLVGPEGGWAPAEVETAISEGALPLRLGPRTLRADTAGAVAIAILQFLWGDLGG